MIYNMLNEAGEYFIEIKTPDKTIKKRVGNKETALKVIKQLKIKQPLTIDTFNEVSFRWFENYVKNDSGKVQLNVMKAL
ncbi:MAG: hypothetical protein OMM_10154 [Candidatus Magnetoglobus multicellularis str. Araruama]|uniref:Uncharacterized protein n=1 Tax=Candidatus Magnetoglobus multicellularis str. Araruama TaxID=890399 RepID=A0A1V1P1X5_9BACT|nr:MAG: hypothetical protein OMM_10154 [Candidatus Magnetoglobus multicellularis str. Araruama]